jgi:hypothetical protein
MARLPRDQSMRDYSFSCREGTYCSWSIFALFAALLACAPSNALARPSRWTVGVSAAYAYITLDAQSEPEGGGASAFASFALTETFALQAAALFTTHSVAATKDRAGGTFRVVSADAGLSYAMDLVRFEPKIEAGIGILYRHFAGQGVTDLGVKIGFAVDYALYPWLAVGFGVYYHGFLTDPGNIPIYVELGPRISFRFGRGPKQTM